MDVRMPARRSSPRELVHEPGRVGERGERRRLDVAAVDELPRGAVARLRRQPAVGVTIAKRAESIAAVDQSSDARQSAVGLDS